MTTLARRRRAGRGSTSAATWSPPWHGLHGSVLAPARPRSSTTPSPKLEATPRHGLLDAIATWPRRHPPPPPPPPPPRKPIGLRSGLPWLSGERHGNVFKSYLADPDTGLPALEAARGRPVDIELVFVDGWKIASAATWASVCNPLKSVTALPWLASLGIGVVLTIPLFPLGGLDGTGLPSRPPALQGRRGRPLRPRPRRPGAALRRHPRPHRPRPAGRPRGEQRLPLVPRLRRGRLLALAAGLCPRRRHLEGTFPRRARRPQLPAPLRRQRPDPLVQLDDVLPGRYRLVRGAWADCYTNQLKAGATSADVKAYLGAGSPDRPLGPVTWAAAARARGKWSTRCRSGAPADRFPADDPSRDTVDFPRQMFDHCSWPTPTFCVGRAISALMILGPHRPQGLAIMI
jgi:hypothetical protein